MHEFSDFPDNRIPDGGEPDTKVRAKKGCGCCSCSCLVYFVLAAVLLAFAAWFLADQYPETAEWVSGQAKQTADKTLETAKDYYKQESGREPTLENLKDHGLEIARAGWKKTSELWSGDNESGNTSSSGNSAVAAPKPAATSSVGALDVSPVTGIQIKAPSGALDKARTFKVTPLPAAKHEELFFKNIADGCYILAGYDFDAGMSETDRFHEPVEFRFDLKELGIPPHVWDMLAPGRVEASGKVALLRSSLKGSVLSMHTRHNAVIVIVGIPAIILGSGYLVWDDLKVLPEGSISGKTWLTVKWPVGDSKFLLKYPRSWKPANPGEVDRAAKEFNAMWKGFQAKRTRAQRLKSWFVSDFYDFVKEPGFQEYKKTVGTRDWILKNGLPKRAGLTAIAMERSIQYLEDRGFKKAGWCGFEWLTEVFVLNKSLGPDCYGNAVNPKLTRGYIELDGTKIPDRFEDELSAAPADKKAFDALQTTAVHEYFHIMQSAYTTVEWADWLWFFEASALILENEAGQAFISKGWAQTGNWDSTERRKDVFFDAMDIKTGKGSPQELQQHGYGQSYFLDHLKEKAFKGKPDQYLVQLMNDFGAWRSSPIKALQSSAGLDEKKFAAEFEKFARGLLPEYIDQTSTMAHQYAPFGTSLTESQPRVAFTHQEPAPISARCMRVTLKQSSFSKLKPKECQLILRDNSSLHSPLINEWTFGGGGRTRAWKPFPANGEPLAMPLPDMTNDRFAVEFFRIAAASTGYTGKGATELFLLQPPAKAPQCRVKNGKLFIQIPDGPLTALTPPGGLTPYLQGYEISIQSPEGGETIIVTPDIKTAKDGVEYPLADLMKRLKKSPDGQQRARVWHREIVSRKQSIYSKPGPATEISLNAEKMYVAVIYPGALPDILFYVDGNRVGGTRRGYYTKKQKQLFTETTVVSGSYDEKTGMVNAVVSEKNLYRKNMTIPILFRVSFKLDDPKGTATKGWAKKSAGDDATWSDYKVSISVYNKAGFYQKQSEQNQKNQANFNLFEFIE